MGYDSSYRREKDTTADDAKKTVDVNISLAAPLSFWIGILVIAALMQLIVIPAIASYGRTNFDPYFSAFANYAIYFPGLVVLPLIASVWIGDRVSALGNKKRLLVAKGIINALYSFTVYIIAMLVIYILMRYLQSGVLAGIGTIAFVEYFVLMPFLINIIIIPLFALLSATRHSS